MTEGRSILADYARHGWALVPIPAGRKGPTTARWNTRDMVITDPAIAEHLDGNVGLAHAYSGTCCIDVDDLTRAVAWLEERGLHLDEYLNAHDAVRIESRPGRAKLLYALSKPLPSFKLGNGALELRCASAGGLTVQDVLPPSVHPDTRKPYEWAYNAKGAHWSKLPPIPGSLLSLWQGLITTQAPTPPRATARTTVEDAPRLRALLELHDPDSPYDDWLAVGMALHHELRGHQSGLMLWNEWSAKGQKYKGVGDLETHWRSFRLDHDNPRTLASLRKFEPATADEFPDVPEEYVSRGPRSAPLADPPPKLAGRGSRDVALEALRTVKRSKLGTIEARISNVTAVLSVSDVAGVDLMLDDFLDAIMVADKDSNQWRPFTDSDYTQLRIWLETGANCDPISNEMMRHAVRLVAERNRQDTAKLWLEGLEWDGVERIDTFCPRYFGTNDEEYERAVGRYLWTALAGRIMDPGCQVDMVPVLIGGQGIGKTQGVKALVPASDHYVEIRLDEPDEAIARKLRGTLIGELAEMRGLRAAEIERVKAFITRTHEKWTPKYQEFATTYARRLVIVGTTNDEEFLPADTEHRRWLPLHTGGVDVPGIRRDRDQLWAEALVRWTVEGIHWHGFERLAAPAREQAAGADVWEELVAAYIYEHAGAITMHDILTNALGLDVRTTNRTHELRVGKILRSLGYSRTTVRDGNKVRRVWTLDVIA